MAVSYNDRTRIHQLQAVLAKDRGLTVSYEQAVEIAAALREFYRTLAEPGLNSRQLEESR